MKSSDARTGTGRRSVRTRCRDFHALSQKILHHANSAVSRIEFLRAIAEMLLDFSECDAVELRVRSEDQCFCCGTTRGSARPVALEVTRRKGPDGNALIGCARDGDWLDELCLMTVQKRFPAGSPYLTKAGSFWTGDLEKSAPLIPGLACGARKGVAHGAGRCVSLAILPLPAAEETIGILQLRSCKKGCFCQSEIERYEEVSQAIGLALVSQLAHASLRERIKELTCLYSLAQLAERPGIQLGEIFRGVVEILPSAWQYPEITMARVVFDGRSYATERFEDCVHTQSGALVVRGQKRGDIEVGYTRQQPEMDEGPFLKEERSLIDTVARQIAVLVERRETAEDRGHLQDQLRHADRLATIGQLSAGVAHELNEPLGNILAFAQLARKEAGVPKQVVQDLDKIVKTSLHAREIIKKLMLFARQMPPRKIPVNFNAVIEEGLYFLEARCSKVGVTIERDLAAELPEIVADPSQLDQVLVNLVVNAIQAMPDGGTLRIATRASGGHVVLAVEDTGIGMDGKVLERIFTPFFTTKDVNEGTGLGLPVVHGIVTSHEGTISVESTPNRGSRFEISIPVGGAEPGEESLNHEIVP